MERSRVFRAPLKNISRKDLRNLLSYLLMTTRRRPVCTGQHVIDRLAGLMKENRPIPYRWHKTGAGNRAGIGVGRTPVKCYRYMSQALKGFRGQKIETLVIKRMYIEQSSGRFWGGYRRMSRGRVSAEDRKRYRAVIECTTASQES